MFKPLALLALTSLTLQAADGWLGTWKLDPSRSHFENYEVFKDLTLVITEVDGSHILDFTVTDSKGKVEHLAFRQPNKGGKLIPIGDSPVENGVLEVANDHEWIYRYYSKDGKLEDTRYVKLSKDGKSHEADMRGTRDGKPFVEHEYVVKQ